MEKDNSGLTWRKFWNRLAASRNPIAATDRPVVSKKVYLRYSDEIQKNLKLNHGDTLLDIGCGPGLISFRLASRVKHITAVDFSPAMAKRARQLVAPCGNVQVVNCDAVALPFKKNIFSKVVIYAVAQYLSSAQIQKMLWEVQRVTRKGGMIFLGEIPRARKNNLSGRIRDVWIHQGIRGILRKIWDYIYERWLRFLGRLTKRFVRLSEPPVMLHSEEELMKWVSRLNMKGYFLAQNKKLPWFHQTFDLLIKNLPH